jgi:hypothetical protein
LGNKRSAGILTKSKTRGVPYGQERLLWKAGLEEIVGMRDFRAGRRTDPL